MFAARRFWHAGSATKGWAISVANCILPVIGSCGCDFHSITMLVVWERHSSIFAGTEVPRVTESRDRFQTSSKSYLRSVWSSPTTDIGYLMQLSSRSTWSQGYHGRNCYAQGWHFPKAERAMGGIA